MKVKVRGGDDTLTMLVVIRCQIDTVVDFDPDKRTDLPADLMR